MTDNDGFYTLKGYSILEENSVTSSMEDYLEMIYRIHSGGEAVRVGALSELLHVRPSSVTKMVENLKAEGLVTSKRYGSILLTGDGLALGKYLVFRHDTLHRLLCYINRSENELKQVERIEHFINRETIENIDSLLKRLSREDAPDDKK